MEIFVKVFLILTLSNLRKRNYCLSLPVHLNRHLMFATTKDSLISFPDSKIVSNFYALTIICLSWVAIAAIAWGFYYGFRGKDPLSRNHELQCEKTEMKETSVKVSPGKKTCCGKSSGLQEGYKSVTVEQTGDKSSGKIQRSTVTKSSVVTQPKEKPGCCKKKETCDNGPEMIKKTMTTKTTTGTDFKEKSEKKGCFKKKENQDTEVTSKVVTVSKKQVTSEVSEPKPKRKCCPCGKKNSEEYYEETTEKPSTTSQFSQKILQEEAPTFSKSQHTPIKYDFQHVKDATPSNAINTGPGVKQNIKDVKSMRIDEGTKVMRPIPTYSTQAQEKIIVSPSPKSYVPLKSIRGKDRSNTIQTKPSEPSETIEAKNQPMYKTPPPLPPRSEPTETSKSKSQVGQVPPVYQPTRPNYILVQPMTKLNPCYEQPDVPGRGYCCTSIPKEKHGNIRPIIDGYKVEDHVRLKGKHRPETISIPDDSYVLIQR